MTYLVFKSPTCKWCDMALELLEAKGVEHHECDITDPENEQSKQWLLSQGHTTVPQVYLSVDDKITECIGGYEDLVEYFKKITH